MYMMKIFSGSSAFKEIIMITFIFFQEGTHCNGLVGFKLPLIQQEVLNIFMSILFLCISIVILSQQIY